MLKYTIKRVLLAVITVFIISAITFFAMNAIPGGPFAKEKAPDPAVQAALEARFNLDKPVHQQFFIYLGNLLHGDFGVSLKKSEEARIESERVLTEYQKQLADAKTQATQIVAEAKQTGEAVEANIKKRAEEEAAAMIEKARTAIEAEKKAAMSDLQSSVADLSVNVASRLVASDLSDDEHRKIIERYINEAGSFNAN